MKIDNIAIVGGGTSGLVCALILRKTYPNLKIDILESESIGIVGVGEGTTEHWSSFMFHCEIDIKDLIKETDATFKYGINFVNWHGDGKNYIHSIENSFAIENETNYKYLLAYLTADKKNHNPLVYSHVEQSLHIQPFDAINQFHFDTFKLNKFLHSLCEKRNIGLINCKIKDTTLDNNGHIKSLISDDNREFRYDFYIDSSGFHKLLLNKTLNSKWISYQKYLPLNSAIAFRTERTEDIPSWTLSRAMRSGWLWRIPTQNSYGNGYVFNEDFISADQAVEEIEKLYEHKIEIAKHIKFDAGHLEKFWIKNCAAVGLSAGFVEPLEASAIGFSIQQSFLLAELLPMYSCDTQYSKKIYNNQSTELMENIIDFVSLHYCTNRNDTNFWKFVKTLPKTNSFREKIELFNNSFPSSGHFKNRDLMFKEANWIYIMHGLGLISKSTAKRVVDLQSDDVKKTIIEELEHIFNFVNSLEKTSHRKALNYIKNS